jgi:ABC-type branched-subunit amino acid transport system ATPase component
MISVGSVPWYALAAGAGITLIPSYWQSVSASYYLQLVFGLAAVFFAATAAENESGPNFIQRALGKATVRWPRRSPVISEVGVPAQQPSCREPTERHALLKVEGLSVRFGGLVAVDGAELEVETGKIVGLIGPNGAGKTTTFNAISGLTLPSAGRILLNDRNLARLTGASRARHGLGRTFQQMELFDSLSVRANVAVGAEARLASANPLRHVVRFRGERARIRLAADVAMSICGVAHLADVTVGNLSTGQRRLVELARCVSGDFDIYLLDEPSSGLDRVETAEFARILRQLVETRGIGILIVEHDIALVASICDTLHVLDFGQPIFSGIPRDALSSPVVQSAYLGTAAIEVMPGGRGGASDEGGSSS